MNILIRYRPEGRTAKEISASVEAGVRSGQLVPGDPLPAVRELAAQLGVSPTTVAAAYGELRRRGLTAGAGRAGTRIRNAPPVSRNWATRWGWPARWGWLTLTQRYRPARPCR